MLSSSDPFIYLGPGCPTLYYPKPSADQTGPSQPLPSFIVPRRSVQPHAFIQPTVSRDSLVLQQQQSGQDISHLPLGTSKKKNPRGQVGKRRTGTVQRIRRGGRTFNQPPGPNQSLPRRIEQPFLPQTTQVQNSSVQTDWLLDTRESFVFVEANQMMSEAVLPGDCGGGVGVYHQMGGLPFSDDDNNKGESNFKSTSVLSTTMPLENSGLLFEMSFGTGNYGDNVAAEGYSKDQNRNVCEILNNNSETESNEDEMGYNEDEMGYNEDAFVLGDTESSYARNVFLNDVPLETEDIDDGGFSEVNICDSLEAGFIASDNTLGYLDREKVFDMEEDEVSFSDTILAGQGAEEVLTVTAESKDFNMDVKEVVVIGSENSHSEASESQAKEIVSQMIDSLLANVIQLSLDSNLLLNKNAGGLFESDHPMNSNVGGFRGSFNSILRSEETIEKIEEFIEANNASQFINANPFSQFSTDLSQSFTAYTQPIETKNTEKDYTSCYDSMNMASNSSKNDTTVKGNKQGMMPNSSSANSGVEDLPVLLCPVTGMVYLQEYPSGE